MWIGLPNIWRRLRGITKSTVPQQWRLPRRENEEKEKVGLIENFINNKNEIVKILYNDLTKIYYLNSIVTFIYK